MIRSITNYPIAIGTVDVEEEISTRAQLSPRQQKDILADYRSGNQNASEIARRHGVRVDSVRRLIKKHQQRQP